MSISSEGKKSKVLLLCLYKNSPPLNQFDLKTTVGLMMSMLPETTDPNGQHNGHQVDIKNLLLASIACMQAASKDQEFAQKRGASSYILFCWTFLEFKDILQLVLCQKCNSHTKDKSFHIWTHTLFSEEIQ